MSNVIVDFYYSNIELLTLNSELSAKHKKKLSNLVQKKEQLIAELNGEEKDLLLNYVNAYNEFSSVIDSDSFISGFIFFTPV